MYHKHTTLSTPKKRALSMGIRIVLTGPKTHDLSLFTLARSRLELSALKLNLSLPVETGPAGPNPKRVRVVDSTSYRISSRIPTGPAKCG